MFAPSKEAFEILSGEDKLSEYTFGNKVFVHKVSFPPLGRASGVPLRTLYCSR